jgi:hypothetical protein
VEQNTKTQITTTQPLTRKEARYLNNLADAAQDYRKALEKIAKSANDELARIAAGNNTFGLGNQEIMEVATKHAALNTNLRMNHLAQEMEEDDEWSSLITAAHTGTITWFQRDDMVHSN